MKFAVDFEGRMYTGKYGGRIVESSTNTCPGEVGRVDVPLGCV